MSFAGPTDEERKELETGFYVPEPPLKRWQVVSFLSIVAFLLFVVLLTWLFPDGFHSP